LFFNVQSTRTNLIHSLKTHCFNCMKQSCKLQVIFYLREFCSLDTDSIEFLMSRSNWCHKSVWIYYYYYYVLFKCCKYKYISLTYHYDIVCFQCINKHSNKKCRKKLNCMIYEEKHMINSEVCSLKKTEKTQVIKLKILKNLESII